MTATDKRAAAISALGRAICLPDLHERMAATVDAIVAIVDERVAYVAEHGPGRCIRFTGRRVEVPVTIPEDDEAAPGPPLTGFVDALHIASDEFLSEVAAEHELEELRAKFAEERRLANEHLAARHDADKRIAELQAERDTLSEQMRDATEHIIGLDDALAKADRERDAAVKRAEEAEKERDARIPATVDRSVLVALSRVLYGTETPPFDSSWILGSLENSLTCQHDDCDKRATEKFCDDHADLCRAEHVATELAEAWRWIEYARDHIAALDTAERSWANAWQVEAQRLIDAERDLDEAWRWIECGLTAVCNAERQRDDLLRFSAVETDIRAACDAAEGEYVESAVFRVCGERDRLKLDLARCVRDLIDTRERNNQMSASYDARCRDLEQARAALEAVSPLHGIAVELAHALRLAVNSEFPSERRAAIDRWEAYVLRMAAAPSRLDADREEERAKCGVCGRGYVDHPAMPCPACNKTAPSAADEEKPKRCATCGDDRTIPCRACGRTYRAACGHMVRKRERCPLCELPADAEAGKERP